MMRKSGFVEGKDWYRMLITITKVFVENEYIKEHTIANIK